MSRKRGLKRAEWARAGDSGGQKRAPSTTWAGSRRDGHPQDGQNYTKASPRCRVLTTNALDNSNSGRHEASRRADVSDVDQENGVFLGRGDFK